MFEDKDVIHERMLNNISDKYDKSEGSFFYDATKPTAIEFEKIDKKADGILDRRFAKTAKDNDLDKVCEDEGVYRKKATKANGSVIIKGASGAVIKRGDMISSDVVNFIFLEDKKIDTTGQCYVKVECEKAGSVGNVAAEAIKYFPATLEGLYFVTNEFAFVNGYDRELDDSLRERYFAKIQVPSTSGNEMHYKIWAEEVIGVGAAKVFPLMNGPGTVGVVIIDSNKKGASKDLIDETYNHIESQRPIGATVTVVSAVEKIINVKLNISIDSLVNKEDIRKDIEKNLIEYFKGIAFKNKYISYAKIGDLIFDTKGVADYSSLKINDINANINIGDKEIAVLGGVVFE